MSGLIISRRLCWLGELGWLGGLGWGLGRRGGLGHLQGLERLFSAGGHEFACKSRSFGVCACARVGNGGWLREAGKVPAIGLAAAKPANTCALLGFDVGLFSLPVVYDLGAEGRRGAGKPPVSSSAPAANKAEKSSWGIEDHFLFFA